jgi:signal peptidase II
MMINRLSGFVACLIIMMTDQLSKAAVLHWFTVNSGKIVVTSFLNIVLAWNKGVSFSLFPANSPEAIWILIGVATLLSLILLIWIWMAETKFIGACLGMILGGALGNIIDRFQFGAVVDFLDFHLYGYHWYTFNIADCGIVLGAALLLGHQLFFAKDHSTGQIK